MFRKTLLFGACGIIANTAFYNSYATENHHSHNHQSPIGVMGGHTHKPGEWMTSYRYSRMEMDGNRDGTSDVSTASVLSNFMVSPTEMTMEMHMFGLMYGATENLTLMAMLPYVRKSMDHVTRTGVTFETEAKGIGDIKLSGLYTIYEGAKEKQNSHAQVHLNLGVALPTGSTDERDTTPAGFQKLPYPMQLGSGTFDPLIGVTYTNQKNKWSWGAQANTVLRLYDNDEGYHLGNEYNATTWVARDINEHFNVSFRLDARSWGDVDGSDSELSPMVVPTARTDLRGGERIDALIGINLLQPEGKFSGHELAAEFGMPIYQNLDGPQLETDYRFILAWRWAFGGH